MGQGEFILSEPLRPSNQDAGWQVERLGRCGYNNRLSVWSMLPFDDTMMLSFNLNIHSMAIVEKGRMFFNLQSVLL